MIPAEEGAEAVPLNKKSLPKLGETGSNSASKNGSQADSLDGSKMVYNLIPQSNDLCYLPLALQETKVKMARAKSAAARADPEAMRKRQEEREAAVAANKQREQEEREAKQKERDAKAEKVRAAKAARGSNDQLTADEAEIKGNSIAAA